jgi:hypothetical protein
MLPPILAAKVEALAFIGNRYDSMTDEQKEFALPFWTQQIHVWVSEKKEVSKQQ